MVAWDPKFIGGHLEIHNNSGSGRITVYSTTDNDKKDFCNAGMIVTDAWWQGNEVYVKYHTGIIHRYFNYDNAH